MSDNPVIILTRPEPQASRFADQLAKRVPEGVEILKIPLFQTELLERVPEIDDDVGAIVFTSENAVRALSFQYAPRNLKTYSVGSRTADVAREHGWKTQSAEGTASELTQLVADSGLSGTVFWPRGEVANEGFAIELRELGIEVKEQVLYRMSHTGNTEPLKLALEKANGAILPVFSSEAARAISALENLENFDVTFVAISSATKSALNVKIPMVVANSPTAEGMMEAIASIFPECDS